ncbi:MAG TPA: hypothetical protein ENJ60_03110 [Aeromonadales bacterium]|nr:hypothetical protein [Aeromonadales bacterium]
MSNKNPSATIVANEWITPTIREIKLKFNQGYEFSYTRGQFISVHLPDPADPSTLLRRSYSIASLQDSTNQVSDIEIVLTILDDGLASQFFLHADIGTTVEISGPYGALTLADDLPDRLFLVATSTGVAPFRTMLPQLASLVDAGAELDIELILGVKNPDEALFASDFRQFATEHPRFQFNLCYSRSADLDLKQDEYSGYVQHRLEALAPNPENSLVYLCGNPNMIDNAYKLLTERGFSPRQVKREKYVLSRR